MSEIANTIGKNIRRLRLIRGYTLSSFADQLSICGLCTTGNRIGEWERGERSVSAEQLYYIARALSCSADTLLGIEPDSASERIVNEISMHPQDCRDILMWLATPWDGNRDALIHFCGLYGLVPECARADIAGFCLHVYRNCVDDGTIDSAKIPVDCDYVEKSWEHISGVKFVR